MPTETIQLKDLEVKTTPSKTADLVVIYDTGTQELKLAEPSALTAPTKVADQTGRLASGVKKGALVEQEDTGEVFQLLSDDPGEAGDWLKTSATVTQNTFSDGDECTSLEGATVPVRQDSVIKKADSAMFLQSNGANFKGLGVGDISHDLETFLPSNKDWGFFRDDDTHIIYIAFNYDGAITKAELT